MFKTRLRKVYLILFVIILLVIVTTLIDNQKHLYGNDIESIKRVITSLEGYENEWVEVLEIMDRGDNRIVGLLLNNDPGYIIFQKNSEGNYKWITIQKSTGYTIDSYVVPLAQENSSEELLYMIVTNWENEVANLKLTINETVIEREFQPGEPSVTLIEFPEVDNESYEIHKEFFDVNGQELKF
ncbi:hypothetical protein N0O92_09075 [Alkalihalobacillus sp. MEB130]|uniref:hypothetical protein n=1 Tax=Alkalihalobacillus sp. MEB130 TaxID=2976704 RepID=UPI0028DD82AC|nr:hypothetical protein [Alkalihalobacillus sp. MEB130]MDT8860385.1 hypothetical protein [Alkalihalobacillus sp. MEB130]